MECPDVPNRCHSTSAVDALIDRYLSWIAAVGYAPDTIRARRNYLRHFSDWLNALGSNSLLELDREQLEQYQVSLAHRRRSDGRVAVEAEDGDGNATHPTHLDRVFP